MNAGCKGISILFIVSVLYPLSLSAQNSPKIMDLHALAQQKQAEWLANQRAAEQFAQQNNLALRQEYADGTIIELVKVVNGIPHYYITHNAGAATTTRAFRLWPGGGLGLNITGSG